MKLTVDIPEKDYKFIRDTYKETGLAFIPPAIKCECTEAVYNGTPYEERKTGKWINHKDEHQCSICGEVVVEEVHDGEWGSQGIYEYCPYCGNKLEVDE